MYPVAPVTEDQLTAILVDDAGVAVKPDGTAGMVIVETSDDWKLSPAVLL